MLFRSVGELAEEGWADQQRLARVLQLIEARTELLGLRVLDLACRTGTFAVALAALGARVLAVDGRIENLDEVPATVGDLRLLHADVRDLTVKAHGVHDVTLCLGILYHLDAGDALRLLDAMRQVTDGFAIVDTHVAAADSREVEWVDGTPYAGWRYDEPEGLESSIGNTSSWWFTEPALHRLILDAGWSTVECVDGPGWDGEAADRRWLVIS